ncbi:NAD(P)/FAD-dependent oxidoreductase [Roseovarius sp. 2305UL8-3]|uniref:NAD(P)/FAD-dependent oxidoreductase n=1 Tax=Roseovarius conchicola TaxID=3121636 RepID=UPI003527E91A
MKTQPDIIVIGGGIAGISAAAALAQEARVTVIEAEAQLAYHSTGRSAAIFVLNYGNATLRGLNAASLPTLNGATTGETVLSPRGELLLAREDQLDLLDAQMKEGNGLERLGPDDALELIPVLRRDQIAAALLERDAQDIDVNRLLQINARHLRACGGTVLTGAKVGAITATADGWRVRAGAHHVSAPILLNAAGAWADHVAALAGVRPIGLQPMRRSAVIMPVPPEFPEHRNWPMVGSISEDWYAKPQAPGLMISPADEDPVEAQDIYPDDMVLAEGLDRFSQMVDLPLVRPVHSWAGLRSFVADRTPVCGFAPDAPGFFWLAGQGGYGVQTSPALGALTAELCLEKSPTLAPDLVAALSPTRLYPS